MAIAIRHDRGNRPVYREAQVLPSRLQQSIRRGFFNYMSALKRRANREILHGKKTGRVYVIRMPSGRRKRHQSSAPGETHANLTGKLRRSLSWRVNGWESAVFGYGVSTDASNVAPVYAPFLEFGTAKMLPRPSLLNAIDKEEPDPHFEAAFDREFGR